MSKRMNVTLTALTDSTARASILPALIALFALDISPVMAQSGTTPPPDSNAMMTISGSVLDAPEATASLRNVSPLAAVRVRLYRDNGNLLPDAVDVREMETLTNGRGEFFFQIRKGDYWIAVDSKSIRVARPSPSASSAWAEQVAGPVGSLCSATGPSARARFFGPCFGGRTADRSDDASSLLSSEHVSMIRSTESQLAVHRFLFSFDVVTTVRDGDDASNDERAIQGSFRQFLLNANAVIGPNSLRFVPLTTPTGGTGNARYHTITLLSSLPALQEGTAVIDGTPYNRLNGESRARFNRYSFPLPDRVGTSDIPFQNPAPAELLLASSDATSAVLTFDVPATLKKIAIENRGLAIQVNSQVEASDLVIGRRPDGERPPLLGSTAIRLSGNATLKLRTAYIVDQLSNGILALERSKLDLEQVAVTFCGATQNGGFGVVLRSTESRISKSYFGDNGSVSDGVGLAGGIYVTSEVAGAPSSANLIEENTFHLNQLAILLGTGAVANRIERNQIDESRRSGVVVGLTTPGANPIRNLVTRNNFDENGGEAILLSVPNETTISTGCSPNEQLPNGYVSSPQVDLAKSGRGQTRIAGKACPGTDVELYMTFRASASRSNRKIGYGSRGEYRYLGSFRANAQGLFSAEVDLLPESSRVAALSIHGDGSTSAISDAVTVQ